MVGSSMMAAAVSSPVCHQNLHLSINGPGIHTEREDSAVILVHQRRVRVLDLVNVVEVLLCNHDLIGDVTGDG